MKCACPVTASEAHEIAPGERHIKIAGLTIAWGDKDLRDNWAGTYDFCSFKCLAEWATANAEKHDNQVLVEGTSET